MTQSLDDVARKAGVSAATVSRALRGLPSVKPETRARIERIAEELGYAISPTASRLATGQTRTIGLLTPWVNRWFFSNIIEGAEKSLRLHNYDALLYTFHETPFQPRKKLDPQVLRRRVDGILVLGLQLEDDEVRDLEQLGVPLMFLGPGHANHPTVGIDDHQIAGLIVDHFAAQGHQKIGHIAGPDTFRFENSPSAGRFRGWQDALTRHGLNTHHAWALDESFDQEGGRKAARALFSAHPDLTAVFAATDTLARGVMQAITERGLAVGRDIAVAGVDDEEVSEFIGLSTVRQNPREQGMVAAELLLQAIAGGVPQDVTLGEIQLIQRASSTDKHLPILF